MTLRLAWRSLVAQPVRSIVLACGFGLGIGSMAGLLGIGEVILEQSRSPALQGGGDVVVYGAAGDVTSARFLMTGPLAEPAMADRIRTIAPLEKDTLYLVPNEGRPHPIRVTGGIPSLERALGDPETAPIEAWQDTEDDARWTRPDPGDVLRAMDRFHAVPDVPERAESWAEWLYFNGRSPDGSSFYLTFLVGPSTEPGRRDAGVRMQLERGGWTSSYAARATVDEAMILEAAPSFAIGASRVELDGLDYRIRLDLPPEPGMKDGVSGDLVLRAVPGRSLPPFQVHGAGGWVSGYVVPVMAGELSGELQVGREVVRFDGGTGYHDHNWGFWGGVRWQWGQVAHDDLAIVWGRIEPPLDAFDADRLPGFLLLLGSEGTLAQSTSVVIDETREGSAPPSEIRVEARGADFDLQLALDVDEVQRTRLDRGPLGDDGGLQLFQMRARCRATGRIGERTLDFEAPASAETFGSGL